MLDKKNKIIVIAIILSILLPISTFAYFDTSLKYGSKGDAVIELQDLLQDQNFYLGKIDGHFGLGTRRAVMAFQKANGLKSDGYFGILSRNKAKEILAETLKLSEDAEKAEIGYIAPTQEAPLKSQPIDEPVDTIAPIVNIQKVTDLWLSRFSKDNTFYGVVGLQPNYTDPLPSAGMIKVEWYMDDVMFGSMVNNLVGKIAWDTTKYQDGVHTLTQKAYDKAGNVGSGSVLVEIKNIK